MLGLIPTTKSPNLDLSGKRCLLLEMYFICVLLYNEYKNIRVERHVVHVVYIGLQCITVLNIESLDNAIRLV